MSDLMAALIAATTEPVPEGTVIAAGLAVKAADTGRVLMVQRAFDDPGDAAAGTWEFPGGKLEPGETPEDGAKREWTEEVGLPLPDGQAAGSWTSPNGVYQGFILVVPEEFSVTDVPREADPDDDGREALAWWTVDDARNNPALRPECADTDWAALSAAGGGDTSMTERTKPTFAEVMAAYAGGDAQALIDWFNGGADGKINWCSPGDFEDCVAEAGKHLENPEGYCNERHQDVCGGPPGSEGHAMRAAASAMGHNGAMPVDRDEIVRQWYGPDGPWALTAAAHAGTYAYFTEVARQRLGRDPYWAAISQEERDKAAASGAAMDDGSYPVTTCDGENSVDTAISAVGRGGADHDAIRRHIIKRANSLGCAGKIPDNWNADGSLKDAKAAVNGYTFAAPPPPPRAGSGSKGAPPAPPAPTSGGAPPKPPEGPEKPPAAPQGDGDAQVDAQVAGHLEAIGAAVEAALKAQEADPDNDKDPADAKVLAGLQQIASLLKGVMADQDADSAKPEPAKAKPEAPPPAAKPTAPVPAKGAPTPPQAASGKMATGDVPGNADGVPGDADDSPPGPGDIENTVKCQNPNCGHLASAHADTAGGDNSGKCAMAGCTCPGMVPESTQVNGPADTTGGQAPPTAPPARTAARAGTAFAPADAEPPQAPEMGEQVQLPPLDPTPNVAIGPQFTIPVAWLENSPTGDGRGIAPEALTWRTPPLPLMFLETSSHDPSGMSPNDPAVLVGRIETVTRDGNKGTMQGHLLSTPQGMHAASVLEQMGRMGVSIDVGDAEVQITPQVPAEIPMPAPPGGVDIFDGLEIPQIIEMLTKGEVMGATVCPFPAFAGAYIVLGDGSDVKGEPLPAPTAEQAAMAIRYVDAAPCEPCTAAAGALVAAATAGPVAPPRAWYENPRFGMDEEGNEIDPRDDPRLRELVDDDGQPTGKFACPITVTADGRYYGHVAAWGVCHQSPMYRNKGQCVLAPRSHTGYAFFHTGSVLTAEGDILDVGRVTADTGHASLMASPATAIAHYDNSGLCAATARAGEDRFGVWVAGAVHPSASPEQVFTLRACPPSGDWRGVGRGSEMVGVLTVNDPGFPQARAALRPSTGQVRSLVAAGVPRFEMPPVAPHEPTADERLAALEAVQGPLLRLAREDARQRMGRTRGRS